VKLVRIGRMGERIKEMAMDDNATVKDIISVAGMELRDNEEITVNNLIYSEDVMVSSGDVILLRTKPQVSGMNSFDAEPAITKFAMLVWNIAHAPDIRIAEKIAYNHKVFLSSMGIR
jgi:pyrroline-5-carboxylate reductase